MGKVIIGIHGLNNKPAQEILAADWLSAINEGLTRNREEAVVLPDSAFKLAYWATVMYGNNPIPDGENPEPYLPAEGTEPLPSADEGIRKLFFRIGDGVFKGVETVLTAVARDAIEKGVDTKAPDVGAYRNDPTKCTKVQNCLKTLLINTYNQRDEIMLIAHSMGSFVAYGLVRRLRRLGES